jgi:hypothetical protein
MTGRSAPLFFALALVTLLAAASCGAPTAVVRSFTPGEPFWLALGESATGDDGGTVVRFAKVVGDSRCPPGAVCVWQGEVTVDLGVRVGGVDEVHLTLGTETPPRSATLPGRMIELLAVEGGHGAGSEGYRAQLRVTFVR